MIVNSWMIYNPRKVNNSHSNKCVIFIKGCPLIFWLKILNCFEKYDSFVTSIVRTKENLLLALVILAQHQWKYKDHVLPLCALHWIFCNITINIVWQSMQQVNHTSSCKRESDRLGKQSSQVDTSSQCSFRVGLYCRPLHVQWDWRCKTFNGCLLLSSL